MWVAYQPKLDLATRQIVGAEALARWTHPEKGPIAASEFVAAAEQHDRIGKLTDFVLDEGDRRGRVDQPQGPRVRHRGQPVGPAAWPTAASRCAVSRSCSPGTGSTPRHLTLELTETAALVGSGEALEMLAQLRELGVNISIDDYGTGLSTLDYLKKIPAGEIKIDQSFVKGMCDNRSDRVMVQSTIALAHSLGRTVVAEGVETRESSSAGRDGMRRRPGLHHRPADEPRKPAAPAGFGAPLQRRLKKPFFPIDDENI